MSLHTSFVDISNGLKLRVLSNVAVSGRNNTETSVIFVHGWPSLAYCWRHQLCSCPLDAYAFDLPGFGESSPSSDMSQRFLVQTVFALLEALSLKFVIVVGHDWGGVVAWSVALTRNPKIVGVGSFCTPLYKYVPGDAVERMRQNPGQFDYQLYFMEKRGLVAAKELEDDVKHTLCVIFRGSDEPLHVGGLADSGNVRKRGGLLVGIPKPVAPGKLLPPEDLRYYKKAFEKSGFANSLLLYNFYPENTAYRAETASVVIDVPALMVTAGKDPILRKEYSFGMEKSCTKLIRFHVENASHWVMEEYPNECNQALAQLYNACGVVGKNKL